MKTLISILITIFLIITFPIMILTGFIGIISETIATASSSITFFCMYYGFGFLLFNIRLGKKSLFKISLSLFSISILSAIIALSLIPPGKIDGKSGLRSHYTVKKKFCLITKLFREIDQVKLGSILIPYVDELIDQDKGERISKLINKEYSEMQSDPDFVSIGTVTHLTYFDFWGVNFKAGHIYVYTPEHDETKKLPVMLFLHGSLSNYKVYMWILKQFADKYKFAIVAPSHGAGDWDLKDGVSVIEDARKYCADHTDMDGDNIILAGLSNGGLGVTRAAMEQPDRYKGLLYLSSILEHDQISKMEFLEELKEKPILVIHGTEDLRIPKTEIDESVELLNSYDFNIELKYFKDEDHFLFLSKKDEVIEMIHNWIGGIDNSPGFSNEVQE